jgi:hypothetical protein
VEDCGLEPHEEEGEAAALAEAAERGKQKQFVGTRWAEGPGKWRAVNSEVTDGQRNER